MDAIYENRPQILARFNKHNSIRSPGSRLFMLYLTVRERRIVKANERRKNEPRDLRAAPPPVSFTFFKLERERERDKSRRESLSARPISINLGEKMGPAPRVYVPPRAAATASKVASFSLSLPLASFFSPSILRVSRR